MPDAEIVAVDMDPVLLELGRAHHGGAVAPSGRVVTITSTGSPGGRPLRRPPSWRTSSNAGSEDARWPAPMTPTTICRSTGPPGRPALRWWS
ncbi:hypothetical protein [Streptomyces wedmorensis]|uniref:hypothetical protein n=1 Tax=Streptomyces wedmorensis TaxID=43759 RepID=UPI003F4D64C7